MADRQDILGDTRVPPLAVILEEVPHMLADLARRVRDIPEVRLREERTLEGHLEEEPEGERREEARTDEGFPASSLGEWLRVEKSACRCLAAAVSRVALH